jgi:antitoxin ParD1/3/4
MQNLAIMLPPQIAFCVEKDISSGLHISANEIVTEALTQYYNLETLPYSDEEIRTAWKEGIESGEPLDGREVFKKLKARFKKA